VKLLLEEDGSAQLRQRLDGEAWTSSRVTYVEACAALAAATRTRRIGNAELTRAVEALDQFMARRGPSSCR